MPSLRRLASTIAVAAMTLTAGQCYAHAAAAPIADPSSTGTLGFCDTAGKQVRSGLVGAAPFAWKIVSSEPAPEQFAKGKAVVGVFQPRPGTDPSDWSGKQLTGSSTFTDRRHPMAEGLRADPALLDFTSVFPPQDHGLVQLRMILAAPDTPAADTYSSVFVRVSGTHWTQVDGGRVDCTSGTATSSERRVLGAAKSNPKQSRPQPESALQVARASAAAKAEAKQGGTATTSGSAQSGSAARPSTVDASPTASHKDDGGGAGLVWTLVGLAVLAALAAGFLLARRRRSTNA